uniref:Uncharacterized protein n=1 Tax=Apteryx owenii TaxID=8824 RepID=A0A8B9Q1G0_APTOW
MTMEEVRRYERETQEATNELIGLVAPAISVSEVGQPAAPRSAPASAPSTPLTDDAPDFLAAPKTRPRKKSAKARRHTCNTPGFTTPSLPSPPGCRLSTTLSLSSGSQEDASSLVLWDPPPLPPYLLHRRRLLGSGRASGSFLHSTQNLKVSSIFWNMSK